MYELFSDHLQTTAHLATRDFVGLQNGRMVRAPRRRRAVQRDRIVNETICAVIEGRITTLEFLRRASNFFEPLPGVWNPDMNIQNVTIYIAIKICTRLISRFQIGFTKYTS